MREHLQKRDAVPNAEPIAAPVSDAVEVPFAGPVATPVADTAALPFVEPVAERFTGNFTQQEPIPEAGIEAAIAVLRHGRLHRYNTAAGEVAETALLEEDFAALTGARYCLAVAADHRHWLRGARADHHDPRHRHRDPHPARAVHVVEAYRPVVEDAEHILADAIQPDLVGRADPEMLTQAVANLIENAIIHTPSGSRVFVALERRENGVAIVVADDGKGIPAGERERVLERFYRLDGSRNSPGAGLGLALVSAVAAIHGASLRLSDNDPGLRAELLLFDVRV